jgi:hypothetical protein
MEGPLLRLLISFQSINKHGHHRQFLFLIGWFSKKNLLWNCLTKWTEFCRKHLWKVLYKDCLSYQVLRFILPSNPTKFGSFCQAILEEKIFRNPPTRNKKCLWWQCLLIDQIKKNNLHRDSCFWLVDFLKKIFSETV